MKAVLISTLFFGLVCLSCKKETSASPSAFSIEKEFRPYFNSFIKEANARNIKIDTTNLIIKFNNSSVKDRCGSCTQSSKNPSQQKTIEIFTVVTTCWSIANNQAREALIFHELGHCLLDRINHKNDTFADGTPKSIMVANNTDLYIPCVYVLDEDPTKCNKTVRRQYYIDELFNPNTPTPSWAK